MHREREKARHQDVVACLQAMEREDVVCLRTTFCARGSHMTRAEHASLMLPREPRAGMRWVHRSWTS
jgi:hypothetical protein